MPRFPIPEAVIESLGCPTPEGHPVLLVFLSPSCPHCRASVPVLNRIAGICGDLWLCGIMTRPLTDTAMVHWENERGGVDFPIWAPPTELFTQMVRDLHVHETPLLLLMDRSGVVRNIYRSEITRFEDHLHRRVERLCNES